MHILGLRLAVLLQVVVLGEVFGRTALSGLESNVIISPEEEEDLLPEPLCDPKSICATLQANDRGISVQRMCRCPGTAVSCPLHWDQYDGRSVTHGSYQYKYCHKAPQVQHRCGFRDELRTEPEPFYSEYHAENLETGLSMMLARHHCYCPPNQMMQFSGAQDGENSQENIGWFQFDFACVPMGECGTEEPCKVVTDKMGSYLVNTGCLCPRGHHCPTSVPGLFPNLQQEKRYIFCKKDATVADVFGI